jgi:hypothetical protein
VLRKLTTLGETLGMTAKAAAADEKSASDGSLSPEEQLKLLLVKEALDELESIEVDETLSTKELLTRMLETKAYRRSLFMRLVNGTLAAAVETKIHDHVLGKPVDRLEIEDKTQHVDNMTLDELHERQQRITAAMAKILEAGTTEGPTH